MMAFTHARAASTPDRMFTGDGRSCSPGVSDGVFISSSGSAPRHCASDLEEVGVTQMQANQIGGGSQLECPGSTINATMQGLAISARILIQPLAPSIRLRAWHFIQHLAHGIFILGFDFLCCYRIDHDIRSNGVLRPASSTILSDYYHFLTLI
jgi:hypothetical protein